MAFWRIASQARPARRGALASISTLIALVVGFGTASCAGSLRNIGGEPDPVVAFAVYDAIEQALSQELFGDNLHSHQLAVAWSLGVFDPMKQASMFSSPRNMELCTAEQGAKDWEQMRCRAMVAVDRAETPCESSTSCHNVRFASFVRDNPQLLKVVAMAAQAPCTQIPDPHQLSLRHHSKNPRGPATMMSATASRNVLGCESRSPVRASIGAVDKTGKAALRIE